MGSDGEAEGAAVAAAPVAIPRRIHRIWLGGPQPDEFVRFEERWRALHPAWEVRTWGEDDLAWLQHRAVFDAAASWSAKANVARYEIVERHGGLYVDTDFEPHRAFDEVVEGVALVLGRQEPHLYACGLFAAVPGHPVLRRAVADLPAAYAARPDASSPDRTGPGYWSRCVRRATAEAGIALPAEGPGGGVGGGGGGVRVLGRDQLYPYPWTHPGRRDADHPAALAVHHWAMSWAAPDPGFEPTGASESTGPSGPTGASGPTDRSSTTSPARAAVASLADGALGRARRVVGRARAGVAPARTATADVAAGTAPGDPPPDTRPPVPAATPLGGGRLLVTRVEGLPLVADADDLVVTPSLLVDGDVDLAFSRFARRELGPGAVAVDVGAGIGATTLDLAQAVGRPGRVVAFEPEPVSFALLAEAVEIGRRRGLEAEVDLRPVAVGAAAGRVTLRVPDRRRPLATTNPSTRLPDGFAADVEVGQVEVGHVEVDVVALDEALADLGAIDLVRVAVAGGEHEVLSGLRGMAAADRIRMVDVAVRDRWAGAGWSRLVEELRWLASSADGRLFTIDDHGVRVPMSLDAALHHDEVAHLVLELAPDR